MYRPVFAKVFIAGIALLVVLTPAAAFSQAPPTTAPAAAPAAQADANAAFLAKASSLYY